MSDPKILFWDIENTPLEGYFWSLWQDNIPLNMVNEAESRLLCFGARWYDKKSTMVVDEREGQLEMLTRLRDLLSEADIVVSWNGQSFDTKKANTAFLRAGLTPPSPYKELDLMRVVKSRFKFASNKLDHVSEQLGLGNKVQTGGFALWRGVMSGDEAAWKKMRRYQKQDVDLLVDLFELLKPWIKMPHPITDKDGIVCRNCGSGNLQRRGVARTLQGEYPRYQCSDCGTWNRGQTRTPVGDTRAL